MTEQELKSQRAKARAKMELLQLKAKAGVGKPAELADAERIYKALMDYNPTQPAQPGPSPLPEPKKIDPTPAEETIPLPAMEVTEFARLLEELTLQSAGFHREMCIRSNRLKDIPDDESAKELVDEIDHFFDCRNEVGVKIQFLKANGRLPEDVGNAPALDPAVESLKFMENLPADKYELSKKLQLVLPNLSKARSKLAKAKDPVNRLHYSQKIAKLELEAELIRSRMKGMD